MNDCKWSLLSIRIDPKLACSIVFGIVDLWLLRAPVCWCQLSKLSQLRWQIIFDLPAASDPQLAELFSLFPRPLILYIDKSDID